MKKKEITRRVTEAQELILKARRLMVEIPSDNKHKKRVVNVIAAEQHAEILYALYSGV